MTTQTFLPIIVAVIGSNAVFGFLQFIIQFLVQRNDMRQSFGKGLEELNAKVDRNQAVLARTHILRFADDLRNGVHHSEEYFRQQMLDCDTYDAYCRDHPNFSNGLTVIASKYIKDEFIKHYTEGKGSPNE